MEIIEKYFPSLSGNQKEKFRKLDKLYRSWNQKVNVISRKDIDQLYIRHVLHSLAIAKYIQFRPGTKILDAGTGGGFPGIPLALYFKDVEFFLIDSIGKKIRVVEAVCEALSLKNCRPICERAEKVKGSFDFVISRAVTTLPKMIYWTAGVISARSENVLPNGILALKGGDLNEELNIRYKTYVINLNQFFDEPFFDTKKLVHVVF
jgi:16S rRNA (guanine527-N7)-methyltransferase